MLSGATYELQKYGTSVEFFLNSTPSKDGLCPLKVNFVFQNPCVPNQVPQAVLRYKNERTGQITDRAIKIFTATKSATRGGLFGLGAKQPAVVTTHQHLEPDLVIEATDIPHMVFSMIDIKTSGATAAYRFIRLADNKYALMRKTLFTAAAAVNGEATVTKARILTT